MTSTSDGAFTEVERHKKKRKAEPVVQNLAPSESEDKYSVFYAKNYTRTYPENSGATEFPVFLESADNEKPISKHNLLYVSKLFNRYIKGIRQLKSIHSNKIVAIFDKPNMANNLLTNKKFLEEHKFTASIPVSAVQKIGVIKYVPIDISNQQLFEELTTTVDIIAIRRFMKKHNDGNQISYLPLQTVAITFATTTTPEYVDLNLWRFPVSSYIPPVKQCYNCLRYGHYAKLCKNSTRCSICAQNHNYKDCILKDKPQCFHCSGAHVAISSACPMKKTKIEENRRRIVSTPQTNKTFRNFPPLNYSKSLQKTETAEMNTDNVKLFNEFINSDIVIKAIMDTVLKIVSKNKNNETTNSKIIKDMLLQSFNFNKTVYG